MSMKKHKIVYGLAGIICVLAIFAIYTLPHLNLSAQTKSSPPKTESPKLLPDTPTLTKKSVTEVAKLLIPSTVNISIKMPSVVSEDTLEGQIFKPGQGTGTGVIIDKKGIIMTNAHVIEDAKTITVLLSDKRKFRATVKGYDRVEDIAVVIIDNPPADLVPANLGNSDKVELGEWVVALGNPLGLKNVVTTGIISSTAQEVSIGGGTENTYFQTDALINPGNSGGPMVNLRGEVIGINTGGGQGMGFAIPINRAKMIMEAILKDGRFYRPYLGVSCTEIDDTLARSYNYKDLQAFLDAMNLKNATGLFVVKVEEESPSAESGLKPGDVIIEMSSKKIEDGNDFRTVLYKSKIDSEIEIKIIRNGNTQTIKLKVGKR